MLTYWRAFLSSWFKVALFVCAVVGLAPGLTYAQTTHSTVSNPQGSLLDQQNQALVRKILEDARTTRAELDKTLAHGRVAAPVCTGGDRLYWNTALKNHAWDCSSEADGIAKTFAKTNLPVCGTNEFLYPTSTTTLGCRLVESKGDIGSKPAWQWSADTYSLRVQDPAGVWGPWVYLRGDQGCYFKWSLGAWGACSAVCSPPSGTQTRTVTCQQNCSGVITNVADGNCISPKPNTSQSCSGPACAGCTLPWGGSIAHGASTTAYQTASVACGATCNSQTRTCNNGVLSGTYTNQNCTVSPCPCNLPWGGSIAHGASVFAYQTATLACGGNCTAVRETRSCNNGVLSGSYTNQSCSAPCASCSLPWGGSIAHGASATAYLTSSVACGNTCTSQTRTCNNGSLSGSYTYGSCSPAGCANCAAPWGGTIWHGDSVEAFQSSSVSCGSSCNSQWRTCNNGFLSGSYTNSSCSVASCPCNLPWGGSVAHGGSVTAYQSSSVSCGSSCNSQTRTCNNGSLSGSYTNSSCSVAPCPCSLPWGGSIAHGGSVTAYQSSSVTCGSCTSQTRSCNNGSLSGSYTNSSCSVGYTYAYGSWSSYGACSVTCGGGTQTRTRDCLQCGSTPVACSNCGGNCSESQACNTHSCGGSSSGCTGTCPCDAFLPCCECKYAKGCTITYECK